MSQNDFTRLSSLHFPKTPTAKAAVPSEPETSASGGLGVTGRHQQGHKEGNDLPREGRQSGPAPPHEGTVGERAVTARAYPQVTAEG